MSFNPQFSRIGEILVHLGSANEEHVKDALVKQGNFGLKIGRQ
jgi:type IV pilus assembly protein PilB